MFSMSTINWLLTFAMQRRKVFQIALFMLSTIMFMYQMIESIGKLVDPPVLLMQKQVKLNEIEPPMITVCPLNQTDEEKLQSYGFKSYHDFLMGNIKATFPTNFSFGEIFEKSLVYIPDKEFSIQVDVNDQAVYKMSNFEKRFYPKYGYCWNLISYNIKPEMKVYITSSSKIRTALIFITENLLNTRPALYLPSHTGGVIEIKSNEDKTYFIELEQHSVYNPRKPYECKHYSDDELEKCVDVAFENFTDPVFVCQPPWLTIRKQCADMNWRKKAFKTLGDRLNFLILYETFTMFLNRIIEMESSYIHKKCPVPCAVIRSKVSPGFTKASSLPQGTWLVFKDIVLITENIISYNFSNFLIDLGSSVGLWFGISVIGLTDLCLELKNYVLQNWMKIKSYSRK